MRGFNGKIRGALGLMALTAMCVSTGWAQDSSSDQSSGAPPAATGPAEPSVENPPLSGLDSPSAEPAFGGRSYFVPGLQLSEGVDSYSGNGTANSGPASVSRVLGSADLQKIWKRSQFALDYIGGGVYYTGSTTSNQNQAYQVHTMAADERILWRTGQLAIRDSFDYLPEGTFGFGSFGGAGAYSGAFGGSGAGLGTGLGGGISGGSPGGLFGGGAYGSVGLQPRIDNLSIVDITEMLSPRSSVTLASGYNYNHFLDTSQSNFNLIDSQMFTAQVGFNHLLNRKDQIGFLYAFQELHFPSAGAGSFEAHVWNALYGHRITGRLDFSVGGGPELILLHSPGIPVLGIPGSTTTQVGVSGNVTLRYTVSARTSTQLLYQHYVTPGSGFYAGAHTDAVRGSLSHVLGRLWTSDIDTGYSRNSRLLNTTTAGISSSSYTFWYAGGSIHRNLGPHFSAFAAYQFDDFNSGVCSTGSLCAAQAHRQTGMIGIDWHPRPIRLD